MKVDAEFGFQYFSQALFAREVRTNANYKDAYDIIGGSTDKKKLTPVHNNWKKVMLAFNDQMEKATYRLDGKNHATDQFSSERQPSTSIPYAHSKVRLPFMMRLDIHFIF